MILVILLVYLFICEIKKGLDGYKLEKVEIFVDLFDKGDESFVIK